MTATTALYMTKGRRFGIILPLIGGRSQRTSLALSSLSTETDTVSATQALAPSFTNGSNKTWLWRGKHRINYIHADSGKVSTKPPVLLIHGFGASAYHWRYNIPYLSRKYNVFAIDLLGFGWSDKPILDYTADIWRDQILDFIREVVHPVSEGRQPCVVVGNSLGGYSALAASASVAAEREGLIRACVLLNVAGRFRPLDSSLPDNNTVKPAIVRVISNLLERVIIGASFLYTRRPGRIAQILRQVYPVDQSKVDDDLVQSIYLPSEHENAGEVFYRVVSRNGRGPAVYLDDLLTNLNLPLLLLWGAQDPWIRMKAADRIQELYPSAARVNVEAGHCPHDEAPEAVNVALDDFIKQLTM
eukprot:gene6463-7129_t